MSATPAKMNPFPGLRPFTQGEDYLFFGREEQALELLSRLGSNRFVAVVGTSGSGKSSLVRCGLLSELLGGKMLGAGAAWEIAVTHPGGNPLGLLTEALLDADLYDRAKENTRENLLATLSRSHFGLVEAVKQAGLGEGTNFLLVVDQFEEIFRFHETGQTQQEMANEFVSLLLEAVGQKEVPIYVVLTMRSDFIGECGQFEGLAEMVNRGEFLIPRLTREQFKRVIEGPVKVAGGQIAPRLLQRLLNDLGQQADQLPCLQHALMRTWNMWAEKGSEGALDLDDYQRVGRMSEALSLHADEVFESLAGERQRELCAGMFKALTVQESENRGIRRPQRLGRLGQILDVPTDELLPIIDAYRRHGVTFLMPSPEVELTDRTIIDISHESLMRVWTRLRHWVDQEAQAAGVYLRLSESAALYKQGRTGLYRDPELGIALAWHSSQKPNAAWAERYHPGFDAAMAFLAASQEAGIAEEQAREAARRHELEQAQQLAEAQKLRLEQQKRAARRLRMMLAGLAVVAVIAGLACVAALVANQRANTQADIARENARRAEQSQEDTEKALQIVESEKAKAQAAERLARTEEEKGRKLLYTTDMQLAPFVWRDDRGTPNQLRDLLAKHIPNRNAAVAKPDLRGFEWSYYQHLLESSAAVFSGHEVSVVDGIFSSDGQLVTLDQNGQVRRWDLDSRGEDTASRRDLPGGPRAQRRVLSPSGRLAALAESNKVHVFDTTTGKQTFQIDSANVPQRRLIFSQDSDKLVIVDDKIRWCDAVRGEVIASVNQKNDRVESLALSADGLTLAVVGQGFWGRTFSIFRLDATSRKVTPLAKNVDAGETLGASGLSPDGQRIAVGWVLYGVVSVFDTTTGRLIAKLGAAHGSPIAAISFAGDGVTLATADAEGTIKVWADAPQLTSKSAALRTLKGHQGAIHSVRFSIDGKQLVSSSVDKTARVWDLEDAGAAIWPLERCRPMCWVARFSPDGRLIAAANGASVRLWDAATGRLVRELSAGDKSEIYSVAFSPTNNRLLAVGHGGRTDDSYVALWDIDAATELARLPGATDLPSFRGNGGAVLVSSLAFSPDGKYLVAGFGNKNVLTGASSPTPLKVWDVATRRLSRLFDGHTNYCISLDFTRDGKLLASGSRDGTAILWSTESWKPVRTLRNPDKDSPDKRSGPWGGMVEDVAFSPDGKTLAMASREGNVQLWDVATGKVEALKGHSSAVTAVVFAPDGRTLASGSVDQTVRLWNVATRHELMRLDAGGFELGALLTLAFSPDGQQLLAGGEGGTTAFWSTTPIVWTDPDRAAEVLRLLLNSNADFQSRIRMLSENLRLYAALEKLDMKDVRVQAALAATRANRHASRQAWPEAVAEFDRLVAADQTTPEAWLRMPGLLRLATALVHQNQPDRAAPLLQGGAARRALDGLPAISEVKPVDDPKGEPFFLLLAAVEKGLAKDHSDAGLLELRAELELSAQTPDSARQVADYTAAIKSLSAQPGEAVPARLQRLHRRRGNAYVRLQKWKEAVDDYDHAITTETTDPLLLSNRAYAHEGLKNWDAAAADWSRAAAGNPRGAKWHAEFAQRLVDGGQIPLAKREFEKSRALYEQSLNAAPDDGPVAEELAQLLVNMYENENGSPWTVLKPIEATSRRGATLTVLPDNSILASGPNHQADRYHVVLTVAQNIDLASVRLEALTHSSLPGNGPGRSPAGSFGQFFWTVSAASPDRKDPIKLKFDNAWADRNLAGRPASSRGFWNIAGSGEGRNCLAIWSMSTPVSLPAGTTLTFEMQFQAWNNIVENLGHFRLSVSGDSAALARERHRSVAVNLTDPWTKLAAAYRLIGDQGALDSLLKRHPEAASAIGDLYATAQDWERAIAEYRKVVTEQTVDSALLTKLATAYESAGRTREAVPHLAKTYDANPQETTLLLKVAALQAWFGQEKELAATRQRSLAYARDTNDLDTAERVAKACSILPSADKAELDAALELGRRAVKINKEWVWGQVAHGMAEYRSGNYAAADQALLTPVVADSNNTFVRGTAAFYRAMSLLRQGKIEEARNLGIAAAAKMRRLPKDENNPLAVGVSFDDLILWLAYKEAKALIKFDAAAPLKAEDNKK